MANSTTTDLHVVIVGAGRAGQSFAGALADAGIAVEVLHHGDAALTNAATVCDVVMICAPDRFVGEVAQRIAPGSAVVAHVAGSLGLEVLAPHSRVGSLHPLMTLPNATVGAAALRSGAYFAVAGDGLLSELVRLLDGTALEVGAQVRDLYHATACIASNHVVALMGQVERCAEACGVPFEAFRRLVLESVENSFEFGPTQALTGPAARGDVATVERHLVALPAEEVEPYRCLMNQAVRLAQSPGPR